MAPIQINAHSKIKISYLIYLHGGKIGHDGSNIIPLSSSRILPGEKAIICYNRDHEKRYMIQRHFHFIINMHVCFGGKFVIGKNVSYFQFNTPQCTARYLIGIHWSYQVSIYCVQEQGVAKEIIEARNVYKIQPIYLVSPTIRNSIQHLC